MTLVTRFNRYVIVALLTAILALSVCLLAYSGISSLVSVTCDATQAAPRRCAREFDHAVPLQVKSIDNGEAQGFMPLCTSSGVPDDIENAAFAA